MSSGGKGGSSSSAVVGYQYFWGMHVVIAHEVNAIIGLRFGDKYAWEGFVTNGYDGVESRSGTSVVLVDIDEGSSVPSSDALIAVDSSWEATGDAPIPGYIGLDATNLFSNNEGGVFGRVDYLSGSPRQPRHPYLYSKVSELVSAARGVASLVFRQTYWGNNPYMRTLGVRAVHTQPNFFFDDYDPVWYDIGDSEVPYDGMGAEAHDYDMNPAHIIYMCLRNAEWGRGLSVDEIDVASFTSAATTLYDELFGLSYYWNRESDVEDLIKMILEHIDGLLYEIPSTGKIGLKLLRDDYVVGSLPTLGPDEITSVEQYYRPGWGEVTNEVKVVWQNDLNEAKTVYSRDQAAINMQGSVVSETLNFPGIRHAELAQRVADRELTQRTAALAQVTLVVPYTHAKEHLPGSVFVWEWPEYGITSMVLRVLQVSYGVLTDGVIKLTCAQDVFAETAYSSIASPTPVEWIPPGGVPQAATHARLDEAPYWHVIQYLTGEYSFLLSEFDDTSAAVMTMSPTPQDDSGTYLIVFDSGSGYDENLSMSGIWCSGGVLSSALTVSDTTVTMTSPANWSDIRIGSLLFIDDEIMLVQAIDGYSLTVARGVLDTVPDSHVSGTWGLFDTSPLLPKTEYASSETIKAKLLTQTVADTLDIADAPELSVTLVGRFALPYPPGKIRVNSIEWPTEIVGDMVLTWAHRNRVQQTAYVVTQDEGSITPEVGTTYTIRIYGEEGQLLRTETGITGETYTYTSANEVSDGGISRKQTSLAVEIESVRDSLTSYQFHRRDFERADMRITDVGTVEVDMHFYSCTVVIS